MRFHCTLLAALAAAALPVLALADVVVRGGAKGSTAEARVTSTPSGVNHQGADVAIYDGAGNLITPAKTAQLPAALGATTSAGSVSVAPATDAIFVISPSILKVPTGGTRFTCGVTGQAASLLECAALSAGRAYVITDIVAQSSTTTAGDFAIQSGTGSNCGGATATVFPAPPMTTSSRFKAPPNTSPPMVVAFATPLVLTTGHALCAIGMATQTLNLQVSGYYYTP